MTDRKTPRLAAALALAVGLLLAFAALGGVGIAQAGGGPGKSQYGKKVMICHKGKRTVRVAKQAVRAHLAHGDTLGRCAKNQHKKAWKHKAHKGHKGEQSAKAGKAEAKAKAKAKEHAAKGKGNKGGEKGGKGKGGKG